MKEKNKIKDRDEGRRGVAILIVIAMLSTLMLMASAFSISMRLERKGAANYRHSVVARHLLWGALGLAMNDIDNDLDNSAGFKVAPDWVGLSSAHVAGIPARVTTAESQYYIPGSIRDAVMTHNPKPEWIPILDSDGTQIGRCAYLVANVSGLLDGNLAGGTNRAAGSSARELQPSAGISWEDLAFSLRNDTHFRYESLYEMSRMNPVLYNALGGDDNGFAHVFSCSTEGEFMASLSDPNDVRDKIFIGGTAEELGDATGEIVPALLRCGFTQPSDAAFFLMSMQDYVDEDCDPRAGADSPNTEAFPMINELPVVLKHNALSSTVGVMLRMEFTYPFVNSRGADRFEYNLDATYKLTCDGVDYTGDMKKTADIGYNGNAATDTPLFFTDITKLQVALPEVPTSGVSVVVNGTLEVKKAGGSVTLDKVTDFEVYVALTPDPLLSMAVTNSWECADPRFNWDFSSQWKKKPPSFAAINSLATKQLAKATDAGYDDDYLMYVADSGTLRNVGELGCILEKNNNQYMYKTFKTYGTPDTTRIFEEFTVAEKENRRGLINVNSTSSNVWAAVFRDAPKGAPDDENAERITDSQAKFIGGQLADAVQSYIDTGSSFVDVSKFMAEVGLENILVANPAVPAMSTFNLSSLERELIISSSAGLLTARQNTFVILLCGEKYVSFALKANEGKSMASMFAVATVSRDPFMDKVTGKHKMFVRSFNVLPQ